MSVVNRAVHQGRPRPPDAKGTPPDRSSSPGAQTAVLMLLGSAAGELILFASGLLALTRSSIVVAAMTTIAVGAMGRAALEFHIVTGLKALLRRTTSFLDGEFVRLFLAGLAAAVLGGLVLRIL